MNEKMTDEAMGIFTLRQTMNQAWTHDEQESVLAHIAALTAERDAMEQERDEASALVTENAHLRERVQALEVELTSERNCYNKQYDRANAAESRLAAIRQRAGVLEKVLRGVLDNGTRHTVAGINAWNAARAVVAPPVSELDGLQGGWCEPRAETSPAAPLNPDATGEADGPTPELSLVLVAPTTADAFATVRKGLCPSGACSCHRAATSDAACIACDASEEGQDALALLERRMGAMERAVKRLADAPPAEWLRLFGELQAAITDAPRVFTLGEVESAVSLALSDAELETGESPDLVPLVRQRLAALRK